VAAIRAVFNWGRASSIV